MSFGLYPAISLADARKLRQDARNLLGKGLSPKQEKDTQAVLQDEANRLTLEFVTSEWLEVKKPK